MLRILFVDNRHKPYNSQVIRQQAMGGIAATTTALSEALVARGHQVAVVNQHLPASMTGEHYGVRWFSQDDFVDGKDFPLADVVIVNSDARLFTGARESLRAGALPVIWLRNRLLLEKTIRRGRMPGLLRWWPVGVFLGEVQRAGCSRLHPLRRRIVLPHGLPDKFFNQQPLAEAPRRQAIYTSQAYRALPRVVSAWLEQVNPVFPDAELHAYVGEIDLADIGISASRAELEAAGIRLLPKVPKQQLIEALRLSRLMIYPGHKDETYCSAAAEASALGVPVVTCGIGSLSERVTDGVNGLLVSHCDTQHLGEAINRLLGDDNLWQSLSAQAIEKMAGKTWDDMAKRWEAEVFSQTSA